MVFFEVDIVFVFFFKGIFTLPLKIKSNTFSNYKYLFFKYMYFMYMSSVIYIINSFVIYVYFCMPEEENEFHYRWLLATMWLLN